jgi:hypothetical protein
VDYPVCPHCKKVIQWNPPGPVAGDAPVEWVTVKKCESLGEADAVRCQLQAVGIVVLIPDEMLMQASPTEGSAYGFIRVQVRSPQVEEAREVLSSTKLEGAPKDESQVARAQLPLGRGMKWVAFLMGLFCCLGFGVFALAKSGYARQGCERKERELWHWFAVGVVFSAVAFFLLVMVKAILI